MKARLTEWAGIVAVMAIVGLAWLMVEYSYGVGVDAGRAAALAEIELRDPTRTGQPLNQLPALLAGMDAPRSEGAKWPEWLPTSVTRWGAQFESAGAAHGVDPMLVAIIALVESGGNASVYSPAGATGLMQVMPGTGSDIARLRKIAAFTPDELLVPATNVDFGTWYLAQQMRAFGKAADPDWRESITLAAAAYNAGPGRVKKVIAGKATMPAETVSYQRWVSGMWAEREMQTSSTYEAWMEAGGQRLVAAADVAP